MRYIITALLLLLSATTAQAGVFVGFGQAISDYYSDVIFYWGCDSTTIDKSSGDTSAAQQVDAAIDTVLYQVGPGSCDFPTAYSRYDLTLNNDDLIDVDAGRLGMWAHSP